jgi:hypothetical protein
MTTTVKQLKEYLETLSDDVTVEAVTVYDGAWCREARFDPLDLEKYSDNVNVYGGTLYLGKD